MILVDSDILIDYLLKKEEMKKFVLSNYNEICISIITIYEILTGSKNKTELQKNIKFIESFNIIQINNSISTRSIELFKRYYLQYISEKLMA